MARTIDRPEVTVVCVRAEWGNSALSSRGVMSERKLETLRLWVLVGGVSELDMLQSLDHPGHSTHLPSASFLGGRTPRDRATRPLSITASSQRATGVLTWTRAEPRRCCARTR